MIPQSCFPYCSAAPAESRLSCSSLCSPNDKAGDATVRRGHSQESYPTLTKGLFHATGHHAQHIELKEGTGNSWHNGICLLKSLLCIMEPCFPGGGLTLVCHLTLLACVAFALPINLSFHYELFCFHSPASLSEPTGWGVSNQLGAQLLDGVKPIIPVQEFRNEVCLALS